jgi:hypothetical protein
MKRNLTELKRAIRPKTNSIRTTFLDLLEELTKSDQGRHFGSRGDEKHFRQLRRQAGASRGLAAVGCTKLHHGNVMRCIFCGKPATARGWNDEKFSSDDQEERP